MSSPTSMTLKVLRDQGYIAAVVETWQAFACIRQDLFGFADILAYTPGKPGVLLAQVTSWSCATARIKKIRHERMVAASNWIGNGRSLEVWGWGVRDVEGKKRWCARIFDFNKELEVKERVYVGPTARGLNPPKPKRKSKYRVPEGLEWLGENEKEEDK